MAKSRLQFEYRKIAQELKENPGIAHAAPVDDSNLTYWTAVIYGPPETPYEGGKFHLGIEFPTEYPFKAPKIKFETKIFHPNISRRGTICVDILAKEWSPILTLVNVLLSLISLLASPNPEDPMDVESAAMFQDNRPLFAQTARRWTEMYAK